MKNSSAVKKSLFALVVFVVLLGLMAWFGAFALRGATVTTPSSADDAVEYDSYSLDLSDWTEETDRNAPAFSRDVAFSLFGVDYVAIGYALTTTAEQQYSIEASLTSPELIVPQNDYLFRFSFFTRMRAATPHEVTLYASTDGETFEKVGSVLCRATGDEFRSADIALSVPFSYLKIGIRTFYSYDDPADTTDRGLYFLSSGFALVAEKADVFERSYFDVTYDSLAFVYNGEKQAPAVSVSSTIYRENQYVFTTESYYSTDTSQKVDSVHAGAYLLKITVRNRSNHVCFVVEQEYVITKAPLTVNKIEYVCNDSYVVVLYADIVDRDGRRVDKEELGLNYFTSTIHGHRTESASPVMNKPSEAFSVGIVVTSDDFIAPTENTFVSVENAIGSSPAYYLEKYHVVTYCGRAFDFTENIFFSVYGTPVTPSAPPTVVNYLIEEDSETIVSSVKDAGNYRCVMTYQGVSQEFFVTVKPRPVAALLYTGKDIVKYYDGTTDLFDRDADTIITQLNPTDLVPCDDPDLAGEDGLIQTMEISDVVTLTYSKAVFARTVGNTYLVLNNPSLFGSDAPNYYIHPSFHVISAVLLVGDVYEKVDDTYVKTTDTYYHEGKTYAKATFSRLDVTVGGTVDDFYYEKSGNVYSPTNDIVFVGGKEYYSFVSEEIIRNNVVSVSATNIVLRSDIDGEGRVITCPDKTYEPNDCSAPSVDSDVALPCYGNGDVVTYADVSFDFDDCNVGRHRLSVTLSNHALYDRYLPEVLTSVPLYGVIVPKALTADTDATDLFLENVDKVYDGTDAAFPRFTDLVLTETPADFPAFSDYTISYESASYTQADVGNDLTLTVSGLTMTGLTDTAASFLSNYSLSEFVVTGDITPKKLIVYSQTLRVFEGENPRVSTNAESDADISRRIYADLAGAEAGGASIPSTRTTRGEYYLRIDSLSDNYYLPSPGYALVPMTVIMSEKTRQKILFTDVEPAGGADFTLLIGSVFSPNVISVEEDSGLSTGLAVSCALSDPNGCLEINENVWTAVAPGTVTLTLSQSGNSYYYEADPLTLTFTVSSKTITGTTTVDGLYGGKALPVLTEDQYRLTYGGGTPSGNLFPSDEKLVASDVALPYTYYFTSDPMISASVADFSLGGKTYYVKSGSVYERAPETYSPYNEYYLPTYTAHAVTAGEAIVGLYYENVFVLTPDTVFVSGKNYYLSSFAPDDTVALGAIVPGGIYYEKTEGVFFLSTDATFVSGKTYYLASTYSAAEVTANAAVDGLYYELDGSVYTPTQDATFDGEKTYYLPSSYVAASVDYGYGVPDDIIYYERTADSYALTEDATFSDKTYYRIVYTLDSSVVPDTSVDGEYYEMDPDGYRLTYDNVFADGKTYYVMEYDLVRFVSAGDAIDPDLYREKGENNSLLNITEGDIFEDTRSYVISVWTEEAVTVGDTVVGEWFEKAPEEYVLTTDAIFIAGKTYYIPQYVEKDVVTGRTVVTGTYEKVNGAYVPTEDTTYRSGKTYYRFVYAVAVTTAGETLNGRTYYEKSPDLFVLTSDATFAEGKTYYRRSFDDVVFLSGNSLPQNEYYYTVPSFLETSDVYFRKDVVYHTVSYDPATVENGAPVVGSYYEKTGETYVLTSDRYFLRSKVYYVAVYTAVDLQPRRVIDGYYHYYFKAQGVYETGVTYYVFDGQAMTPDAVEASASADDNHYYAVVDTEFEQGKTYYYLSYPFLGRAPVTLNMTAQKPTVTVYIGAVSSSVYGEEPDLYDLIDKVVLFDGEDHILPLEEWRPVLAENLSFDLMFIEPGEEPESLVVAELDPGVYSFETNQRESYSEPTAFLKMTAATNANYSFVLANSVTTHTITKGKITVRLPERSKYYGESVPRDEDLFSLLTLENCPSELVDTIKYNLTVSVQAYSYSSSGQYPILLLKKTLLSVGSAVPENTYYERSEDNYYLTTDTVFIRDKAYYVIAYVPAVVTPGDPIDMTRYFILNNDTYIRPAESTFQEGTTYYERQYQQADIYQGETLDDLSLYYDILLVHGFILIDPISVSVGAQSLGHDYGNNVAEITPSVTVLSSASLTQEELNNLRNEVLVGVTASCEVSPNSDSGYYPIAVSYNGTDGNVRVTVRYDCFYTVRPAKLNANADAPSFTFNDSSVLYDGKLHTITVSYNARLWENVTITYDKGSFSEIGNYLYKAVVSQKNYEDLVLTATMSICSLTVSSSNKLTNYASVSITDPTCYNGVNGDFSVVLRTVGEEADIEAAKEILEGTGIGSYELLGIYSLATYLGSEEKDLGYSSYDVTISPTNLEYRDDMALYAYSHGQFQKVDFSYENGAYSFSVSSSVGEGGDLDVLSRFVFVREVKTEDQGVEYKWLYVAIIGGLFLITIGIIISAVTSAGKASGRSRKRHHRWI